MAGDRSNYPRYNRLSEAGLQRFLSLRRILIPCLYLSAVALGGWLLTIFGEHLFGLEYSATLYFGLFVSELLVIGTTNVLFALWVLAGTENLCFLSARALRISPLAAFLYVLIPLVQLGMASYVLDQLVQRSKDDEARLTPWYGMKSESSVVNACYYLWALGMSFWIIGIFYGLLAAFNGRSTQLATICIAAGVFFGLLSTFVGVKLVRTVEDLQKRRNPRGGMPEIGPVA
ncbi:MAG TPA: DUF4328 domain-containing protein [Fimbriimonas sp.]